MAAFSFSKAFRTVWHSLTSYDRHSDFDSPFRTGQHVPLGQSRHAPLTFAAANASESRVDVSSSYFEGAEQASLASSNGPHPASPSNAALNTPYSPGMRSTAALQRHSTNESLENTPTGEIQMQAFQEGLPPPPPCPHSWRRIDKWAEEHYAELYDQLGEGCTNNDLNELEHQLDSSLPMEVRESLQCHDGQENGGRPTGIIFGCMLLDCEEIVHEWNNWRVVNMEYLTEPVTMKPATPVKALFGSSSASSSKSHPQSPPNPMWRHDLQSRQDSQPPNAIQKVYAHPGWIPLARDWGGNNLAVDLAPGPAGKWGQVILFGRDYDCKYVVARSWSAFLATVADDLNSGKWFVDEETSELKLREFKAANVEPAYMDILRWRADQKYGRKVSKKRAAVPAPIGTANAGGSANATPYSSPPAESGGEPRGRSMQRFSGASPVSSPQRPSYGKSSPLARVAEEGPSPIKIHTNGLPSHKKLVEVATPPDIEDKIWTKRTEVLIGTNTSEDDKENAKVGDRIPKIMMNGSIKRPMSVEGEDTMKNYSDMKIEVENDFRRLPSNLERGIHNNQGIFHAYQQPASISKAHFHRRWTPRGSSRLGDSYRRTIGLLQNHRIHHHVPLKQLISPFNSSYKS